MEIKTFFMFCFGPYNTLGMFSTNHFNSKTEYFFFEASNFCKSVQNHHYLIKNFVEVFVSQVCMWQCWVKLLDFIFN